MAYIRKTFDAWELQVNYGYGHGWEVECIEDTRQDAIRQLKCYRENINYPVRLVKIRIKKESA